MTPFNAPNFLAGLLSSVLVWLAYWAVRQWRRPSIEPRWTTKPVDFPNGIRVTPPEGIGVREPLIARPEDLPFSVPVKDLELEPFRREVHLRQEPPTPGDLG